MFYEVFVMENQQATDNRKCNPEWTKPANWTHACATEEECEEYVSIMLEQEKKFEQAHPGFIYTFWIIAHTPGSETLINEATIMEFEV